jgi:hypothetical protein
MVRDVVFHEFGYEDVDGSPCRREPLKDVRALFIVIEGTQSYILAGAEAIGVGMDLIPTDAIEMRESERIR